MAIRPSVLRQERLKLLLRIIAISALIGFVYGSFVPQSGLPRWVSIVVSAVTASLVSGSIGAIEIFLLRAGTPMARLVRLPFIAFVALKTIVYTAIVAVVTGGSSFVTYPLAGLVQPIAPDRHAALVAIGFSLVVTVIFVITLQAAGLVGRRTFRDLVLGRYRRPRAERCFFLFVDVVGSTAIAERLGPMQAHRFLSRVFSAVAEPVAVCRGEIYQYVGDEIVVTWTEADGAIEARPLRCFFEMSAAVDALGTEFATRFGAKAELRAALHLGEVIAGEVGEQRRAIVFHGDVMNTASRLEQATREHRCRFIASADALRAFGPLPELVSRDLGALALRGRKEPIPAFGIERFEG